MSRCTSPLSWLRLEQYHARALSPSEHGAVAAHLEACPACAQDLARIASDDLARELPALSVVPEPRSARPYAPRASWRPMLAPAVGGLALAATVLLALGRSPHEEARSSARDVREKGTSIAFSLVGEGGDRAEAGLYRDGERVKVLVTCPPGLHASWDLVVFERGEAAFPLEPAALRCENQAVLPGAFRLTGHEPMTLCLVWSEAGEVDRNIVRRTPPELLPSTLGALCERLTPVP